jgi:hypothetical protein
VGNIRRGRDIYRGGVYLQRSGIFAEIVDIRRSGGYS